MNFKSSNLTLLGVLLQRRQDLDAEPLPGLQLDLSQVLLGLAQELLQRAGRHVLRDEDHLEANTQIRFLESRRVARRRKMWSTRSRVQFLRGRLVRFSRLQSRDNNCLQYAYSDACCET